MKKLIQLIIVGLAFGMLGEQVRGAALCPKDSIICHLGLETCCSEPNEDCPTACSQKNILPGVKTVYVFQQGAILYCYSSQPLQPANNAPPSSSWVTCGSSKALYSSSAVVETKSAPSETVYFIKDNQVIFSCD